MITARLNQYINDVSVLIDRTPEILLLALNRHKHFVQIPNIAEVALPPLQPPSVAGTELAAPL